MAAASSATEPLSKDHEEALIAQLCGLTGAEVERARYLLEGTNWNIEVAASVFFEDDFDGDDDVQVIESDESLPVERAIDSVDDEDVKLDAIVSKAPFSGQPPAQKQKMSKKFATLGSLNAGKDSGEESSDEDERKKGQSYYVGGSERSGQEVVGPPRQDPGDDVTNKLFEAARAHGAEPVPSDGAGSSRGGAGASVRFHGSGYRLGDNVVPSARLDGSAGSGDDSQMPQQNVTLMMWEDGFSVDDGPLRRFNDPANRAFLESIMQGQIPTELVHLYPGKEIDMKMERKSQPYKPPKAKPFAGQGQRLGGLVPQIVGATATAPAASAANESAVSEAQSAIELKEGEPVTQLQIRLQSGQRLVAKFNHSHTVADVRSFIVAARPELAYQPFQLMTNFPNKVIDDESQTLATAGLINAVIVLKST